MKFKEIPVEECGFNALSDWSKYVLVTAGTVGQCNTLLVTWGSFGVMWRRKIATVYIRESRYTKTFLDSQDYFTLSMLSPEDKPKMSYMGSHSGRDEDKYEKAGLHLIDLDGAAGIEEANLVLVCKKVYTDEMAREKYTNPAVFDEWNKGRNEGNTHHMYIGEIIKAYVKE